MVSLKGSVFSQANFLRLFLSFFVSEFGGFLTNTAILLHINATTNSDLFYLGLGQVLLVLPLAIGTAIGGSFGEAYNKKKVMLACESINLVLVTALIFLDDALLAILIIRAFIVLSAGIYGPSRQAIVQELIDNRHLRVANAGFSSSLALFHALSPFIAVLLYNAFGGVKEIFAFNSLTYALGVILLCKMRYQQTDAQVQRSRAVPNILRDIKEGIDYIRSRPDLIAIQFNFLLAGIMLGAFYPSILPFIKDVYQGGEAFYARIMFCLSLGAIFGGVLSPWVMKHLAKGQILVTFAFLQAGLILFWTTLETVTAAYLLLFVWGAMTMVCVTVYQNYIQLHVTARFRTRAFSILDLTVSASNFIGAAIVMMIGNAASAQGVLTTVALSILAVMIVRAFGNGLRVLYQMPA